MKAMLLSAGLGQRMLPLTLHVPKPAIPVLGRPMALEILARMARHGIDDVVVNLHHRPEVVEKLLRNGSESALPALHFSFEKTILGTAGGIGKAAPLLRGAGPILVHNCDFLFDIDLEQAVETHRRSGKLATMVLTKPRRGYPTVEVDAEGNVLSIAGQPEADAASVATRHLFTGCHVIEEDVLDMIPADRPSGIVDDVYRGLAARGLLGAYIHRGFWWEFGTPEHYLEGTLRLLDLQLDHRLEITTHDAIHEIAGGVAALGPGAMLQDGIRIEGRAVIGLACLLGEGSHVEDSVVMPEAWIGPDCRLEQTVVGPGTEIPAGFECRGALVCDDTGTTGETGTGVRREGELLIYDFVEDRRPTR
jgi:NDP-sugar pyrophosphorylase family protein